LVDRLERGHPFVQSIPEDYSYVAVLSGGKGERLIEALRLWKTKPGVGFITTAWGESSLTFMGFYARGLGIEKLITLTNARDTEDEILKIKELVGDRKVVIVSSAIHLTRARLIAKPIQINALFAPGPRVHSHAPWWNISSSHLLNSDAALHEYLGILWIKLKRTLGNF